MKVDGELDWRQTLKGLVMFTENTHIVRTLKPNNILKNNCWKTLCDQNQHIFGYNLILRISYLILDWYLNFLLYMEIKKVHNEMVLVIFHLDKCGSFLNYNGK